MESLTSLFGISDCIVNPLNDYKEYINKIFDFEHINTIRLHELEKSKAYLNELL
jgi:phosphoribulokinase